MPNMHRRRRKAPALIADAGEPMQASAPPAIAEEFPTVLKAIDTSVSNVTSGAHASDVLDPVYGERNRAAFTPWRTVTAVAGTGAPSSQRGVGRTRRLWGHRRAAIRAVVQCFGRHPVRAEAGVHENRQRWRSSAHRTGEMTTWSPSRVA
jgi:hypothetical protein